MSINKIVTIAASVLMISACASKQDEWFVTHNGNMPAEDRIAQIEAGSTKDEVLQILGAPSSIVSFDEQTWIYMSSDIKRIAFMAPKETDRNILKIRFADDKVTQITRLSEKDGKNITPNSDKTEVKGEKIGFFRKYFGGVGQYNPFAGKNPASGI